MNGARDARAKAGFADMEILALLDLVAGAMREIERAKQERSAEEVRAARTQLAALHGVARLRRENEDRREAAA